MGMLPENMNIVTVNEGRNYHRYLYKNGVEISALAVTDFTTNLGETGVRTGGIGYVRTPEEHRRKGYMRILMEDTCTYMEEQGYDISMLIGIPHFYHKYGYAVTMPLFKQRLDHDFIHDLDIDMSDIVFSDMTEADYPEIVALFNRNNFGRPGTVVRYDEYFGGFARGSVIGTTPKTTMVRNRAGKLIAYFVEDKCDKSLTICELVTEDRSCFYQLMRHFNEIGHERDIHDIDFVLPQDHEFIDFIRRYGFTVHVEYPQNGMMMSRVCNLKPLFEKMVPELQKRLRFQLGETYSGALSIITDKGTVTLSSQDGTLSLLDEVVENTLKISQKELIQMMTGYRKLGDVLVTPEGVHSCGNEDLASLLHPNREPFLWPTDHF